MTSHPPHLLPTVSLDDLRLLAHPDEDRYEDLSIDGAQLRELALASLAVPGPPLTVSDLTDEGLFKQLITGDHRTPVRAWALDEVRTVLEEDPRFVVVGNVVRLRDAPAGERRFSPGAKAA